MTSTTYTNEVRPEHGYDVVIVDNVAYNEVSGWIHEFKSTDTHLAVMVGNRKTPKMFPIAMVGYWYYKNAA